MMKYDEGFVWDEALGMFIDKATGCTKDRKGKIYDSRGKQIFDAAYPMRAAQARQQELKEASRQKTVPPTNKFEKHKKHQPGPSAVQGKQQCNVFVYFKSCSGVIWFVCNNQTLPDIPQNQKPLSQPRIMKKTLSTHGRSRRMRTPVHANAKKSGPERKRSFKESVSRRRRSKKRVTKKMRKPPVDTTRKKRPPYERRKNNSAKNKRAYKKSSKSSVRGWKSSKSKAKKTPS